MIQFTACLLAFMVTVPFVKALDCASVCACQDNAGDIEADCSNRDLTAIPSGFDEFTVELNMAGNNLSSLNADMFQNFTQLKKLDLSRCHITDIASDTFLPLSNTLETLVLESNLLTDIEAGIFQDLQLTKLSLSKNFDLVDIDSEAFDGCSIDKLHIDSCNLSEIHNGTLEPLKDSLQMLLVSHNAMELSLPVRVLEGFTLSSVVMENNSLASLDFLYGSSCGIVEINHNPIGNDVLSIFEHVNGIEELYASDTGITEIRINIVANYSIYVLDLSDNEIRILDVQQFQYFPYLLSLLVTNNNINQIPKDLHQYVPSLTYVDFSNNLIMTLDAASFTNLNIQHLDLNNNNIQTVPEDLKPLLNKMEMFRIEGNRLHCNCELLWFAKWVKSLSSGDTDVHVDDCVTPEQAPLLTLRDMEFRCMAPIVLFVAPESIEPGKRVSFHCKAKGDPPPQIQISSSNEVFLTVQPHPNKTIQQTEAVLHINDFDCDRDFDDYECTAINVAGEVSEQIVINETSIAVDASCNATETITTTTKPTPDPPGTTPKSGAATDDSDSSNNTGYIVAIVVCVILLFVALVIGGYCYWQKKTSQTYKLDNQSNGETKVHYTNEGADVSDVI